MDFLKVVPIYFHSRVSVKQQGQSGRPGLSTSEPVGQRGSPQKPRTWIGTRDRRALQFDLGHAG